MTSRELYNALLAAGVPLDSHESDLYVKVTPESRALVREYQFRSNVTTFVGQIDKQLWYDVPFAYQPFWDRVERISHAHSR